MRGRDMDALSLRASSPSVGYVGDMGGTIWPMTGDTSPADVRHRQGARHDPTMYTTSGAGKRSKISSLRTWERKGSEGPLSVYPNECECVA